MTTEKPQPALPAETLKQQTASAVKAEEKEKRSILDEITDASARREADYMRLTLARANQYHASGAYSDLPNPNAAALKIEIGRALGIPEVVALQNIYLIFGSVALKYTLVLALMKRAGYGVRILRRDDEAASIQILIDGKEIDDHARGIVTFTMQDAHAAGLVEKSKKKGDPDSRSMYEKWPRRMLFARAVSEAAAVYAPDVLMGYAAADPLDLEMDMADDNGGHPSLSAGPAARLKERLAAAVPLEPAS
jgi:hypothetical protein